MKKSYIAALAAFGIVSLVILGYGLGIRIPADQDSDNQETFTPDTAPELSFTSVDGKRFALKDFKDKVIILNFWATYCAPCVAEFPSMLELVEKSNGAVVLIALSQDEKQEDISRFLARFENKYGRTLRGDSFRMVLDTDQKISREYFSVMKLPETVVVDRNMRMIRKVAGAIDWSSAEALSYFSALSQN